MQSTILDSVGCLWFNHSRARDHEIVTRKEHFKEQTTTLFLHVLKQLREQLFYRYVQKGVFELGATVCPIVIKHKKIFVDAF
nr:phospholipid/glycerol acyltransferase [Tanacetum cinerariifolium]